MRRPLDGAHRLPAEDPAIGAAVYPGAVPEQRPLWKSFVVPLLPIPFFFLGVNLVGAVSSGVVESVLVFVVALLSAGLAVVTFPSMFGRYERSEKWDEFRNQYSNRPKE